MHCNIILPSTPRSSIWSLSSGFPTKTMYAPVLYLIRATCPTHPLLLDLMTRILGKEISFSLCNFLQSPFTSSLIGPNISLSTLFSYISAYILPFNVRNQVLLPYTTGEIVVMNILIFVKQNILVS
jgi:hypothetical protein